MSTKNLLKKFMSLLFESICVLNGRVLNLKWHELRYHSAYSKLFGASPKKSILAGLQIPIEFQSGKVKLKIIYGQNQKEFSFQHYKTQKIKTTHIHISLPILLLAVYPSHRCPGLLPSLAELPST